MSAPKTKKRKTTADGIHSANNGVQLIVFAPVNSDPDDEDHRVYMVCPSSMKVVEVIEKYDEEAEQYLELLGRNKRKSSKPAVDFVEDLETIAEISDDLIEDNSGSESVVDLVEEDIKLLDSELDEDIVSFASDALGDIFPDDGSSKSTIINDIDLDDALALLDQEEDDSDLAQFSDFVDDDDSLPAL
jgi:hypothetical protein